MIIDPWGKILAQLGGDGPGIAIADIIDLAAVDEAREKVPALANARDFSLPLGEPGALSASEDVSA